MNNICFSFLILKKSNPHNWEFRMRAKVHPHRFCIKFKLVKLIDVPFCPHQFANVTTSVEFRQTKLSSKGNIAIYLVLVGSRALVSSNVLWGA